MMMIGPTGVSVGHPIKIDADCAALSRRRSRSFSFWSSICCGRTVGVGVCAPAISIPIRKMANQGFKILQVLTMSQIVCIRLSLAPRLKNRISRVERGRPNSDDNHARSLFLSK